MVNLNGFPNIDEATFAGQLTAEEADTSNFIPSNRDRRLFQQALDIARSKFCTNITTHSTYSHDSVQDYPRATKNIGLSKRKSSFDEWEETDIPKVEVLILGRWELRPWYAAPLPAEFFESDYPGIQDKSTRPGPVIFGDLKKLWACEWCLKFFRSRETLETHIRIKCFERLPPGSEIYRKGNLSVFEVNGRFSRSFCQRLCLFSKMFLDHKAIYNDVESFLFYILVEWDIDLCVYQGREGDIVSRAKIEAETDTKVPRFEESVKKYNTLDRTVESVSWSIAAYFSKEKESKKNYNLSCIMTLPHHQRKGYGAFLIDFSYLLSRRQLIFEGTPERPLTDLGLAAYVKYWCFRISECLINNSDCHIFNANDSVMDKSAGDVCRSTKSSPIRKTSRISHRNSSKLKYFNSIFLK